MIVWDVNPILLSLGSFQPRWYGLLFGTAFISSYHLFRWMLKRENYNEELADYVLICTILGTVVGARLAHCFFYSPQYYLSHPLEIIQFWKGGLASHGGALGLILGLYVCSRIQQELSFRWIINHGAVLAPLGGACVRFGNLFNSEIIGRPSNLPWAFIFKRIDDIPRHPTQLYEALFYLVLFGFSLFLYLKTDLVKAAYKMFGIYLSGTFTFRFLVEFTKKQQATYELETFLNVGQMLSIPFLLIGLILLVTPDRQSSQ